MSKKYDVEAKFGKTWVVVESMTLQTDAMHYVKEHIGERYPMRIIRVVKTVVFEDKSHG